MAARDVEGLRRRGHGDQPVGNLRHRRRHDQMLVTGIDQIVMDLVRDQDQVVAPGEIGDLAQFRGGPDPTAGVVRRTEDHHLFAPGHLRVPCGDVERIAPAVPRQTAFDDLAPSGFDDAGEGVVDRRHQDDAVAGLREGLDTDAGAVDKTVSCKDPLRRDLPAMAGFHPPADRVEIGAVIAEIAVDPVAQLRLDRVLDAGRGAKVHVGDPHGNAVLRIDPVKGLHLVPFRTMGSHAVDDVVKTHIRGLVQTHVTSSAGPGTFRYRAAGCKAPAHCARRGHVLNHGP